MCRSLTLALLLALPTIAAAAPASRPAKPAQPSVTVDREGWLAIGGVAILQLKDKSVCESLAQRSEIITTRLVNALEKVHRSGRFRDIEIRVAPPAIEPWIVIEGVPVMKVTTEDVTAVKSNRLVIAGLAPSPALTQPSVTDAKSLAEWYAGQFEQALRRVYGP